MWPNSEPPSDIINVTSTSCLKKLQNLFFRKIIFHKKESILFLTKNSIHFLTSPVFVRFSILCSDKFFEVEQWLCWFYVRMTGGSIISSSEGKFFITFYKWLLELLKHLLLSIYVTRLWLFNFNVDCLLVNLGFLKSYNHKCSLFCFLFC